MNVTRYGWLGPQRIVAVCQALNQRLSSWLGEWASPGCYSSMIAAQSDAVETHSGGQWWCSPLADGRLYLWLPHGAKARLGAWLVGASASGDHGLAAGVGARALGEAVRVLRGGIDGELTPADDVVTPSLLQPRNAGLLLRWSVADMTAWVYLDAAGCDLVAPPLRSRAALAPLKQAIGTGEVTFQAVLDLGAVALSEVSSLQPGDLLRTRIPVKSGIKLTSPCGQQTAAAGVLVAQDGRRAIRIQSVTTGEKK